MAESSFYTAQYWKYQLKALQDPARSNRLQTNDSEDLSNRSIFTILDSEASIRELGHALGLPHIGPIENDQLGNSLMGPVIRAYAAKNPRAKRVYLTQVSAAFLWKHPLPSGTSKDRDITPTPKSEDFKITYDKDDVFLLNLR